MESTSGRLAVRYEPRGGLEGDIPSRLPLCGLVAAALLADLAEPLQIPQQCVEIIRGIGLWRKCVFPPTVRVSRFDASPAPPLAAPRWPKQGSAPPVAALAPEQPVSAGRNPHGNLINPNMARKRGPDR